MACSAECSANKLVESGVLVCVWEDDAVVLCAHVRLHTLAVGAAPLVNVLAGSIAADKGDGTDVLVVADKVDAITSTFENVIKPVLILSARQYI